MKTTFKSILALAIGAVAMVFTSCSKDDDVNNVPSQKEIETKIIGRWEKMKQDGKDVATNQRTVREDNRQGKGGGEDTRVVPYLQHVPDGCAYTPEMGLARAAGALRAERPGMRKGKRLKCDCFTPENDKRSHFQEKNVFLEVTRI